MAALKSLSGLGFCMFAAGAAFAQASTDTGLDQRNAAAATATAEANARTAEANADKARSDADMAKATDSAAIAKAKFGDLGTVSTSGTTTGGDKAGQIEGAILGNEASTDVAWQIVASICGKIGECKNPPTHDAQITPVPTAANRPAQPIAPTIDGICQAALGEPADPQSQLSKSLYIYAEASPPVFDHADAVRATLCGLHRKLSAALEKHGKLGGQAQAIAPLVIGAALSVIGNLFRSDYTVQGIPLTPDDLLLAKSVASWVKYRTDRIVYLPSLYRPPALTADNPIVIAVTALSKQRDDAAAAMALDQNLVDKAAEKAKKTPKQADAITKAAKPAADAVADLTAAAKAYDDYLTKIATPSDKGITDLSEAAREALIEADLARGAALLVVKMNATGGSYYTKKNFWTFFGGVPFFISGGTVGSYTLIDGADGSILAAGTASRATGFETIGAFERRHVGK